jgi:hypothetical protein
MRNRRTILLGVLLAAVLIGSAALVARRRLADCAYLPVIGGDLLPNAGLAPDPASPRQASGWGFRTSNGVELQQPSRDKKGFDLDGDDRALQLIGIGNYVETPPIPVQPGTSYCFAGFALTDEAAKGATRARLAFRWLASSGAELGQAAGNWQPVALWQPGATSWSPLRGAFRAPAGAAQLRVRVQPAADNRLYLDGMHVRRGGTPADTPPAAQTASPAQPSIAPWPNGYRAALSFSWDWETTMGGLIHSRSLASDDLHNADDPRTRGLRMRQGITTTLELFRPYGIQATYYATGYNFLDGNTARQTFMGNPTFAWAKQANGWKRDWSAAPWFSSDPYGTLASDPDYYFADLIQKLQAERQDLQSHTFSHLYGGYASAQEWAADFAAWRGAAAARGVPMARSLAFPWSSSAGMSDDNWGALEAAGITSVTRTNWSQPNYQLADRTSWRCAPVPGHESILACPDFYMIAGRDTPADAGIVQRQAGGGSAEAIKQIDRAIATGGMIDIWAHTEEATSAEQIADWQAVIGYAARARDAGTLWIAPLSEIADWQAALAKVKVKSVELKVGDTTSPPTLSIMNESNRALDGIAINFPFNVGKCTVNGKELKTQNSKLITLNLLAGQSVEVQAWPA